MPTDDSATPARGATVLTADRATRLNTGLLLAIAAARWVDVVARGLARDNGDGAAGGLA